MYINLSTEQLKYRLSFNPGKGNYDTKKWNTIQDYLTETESHIRTTLVSEQDAMRKVEQYDIYEGHEPSIFNQPVRVIAPYGGTSFTYTSGGLFAYTNTSANECGAMAIYLLYNFLLEQRENDIIYSKNYNTVKIWSLLNKETQRFCDENEVYPIVYQRIEKDPLAPPLTPNQDYLVGTIKTDGTFVKQYAAIHYHPKRSVILESVGTPNMTQEADTIDELLPGIIINIIQHG